MKMFVLTVKEMEIKMLKKDLKDGMVVELRNGQRYLLINNRMLDLGGFVRLTNYSEDLKNENSKGYDIVKVYEIEIAYSLTDIFKDANLTLTWERKEYELTDKEVEVLKELNTLGFNWIARDYDDELNAFTRKPKCRYEMWYAEKGYSNLINNDKTLFSFIQWIDNEPTKIDDLLKGV